MASSLPSTSTTPYTSLLIVGASGELGKRVFHAAITNPLLWFPSHPYIHVHATYLSNDPNQDPWIQQAQANTRKNRKNVLFTWHKLDLSDHAQVRELLDMIRPKSVIHCAVPKHGGAGGSGGDHIRQGIKDDVVYIAKCVVSPPMSARFIAMSTDLVFDGKKPGGLYKEQDQTSPTNPYSVYKVEMENALLGAPWDGNASQLPNVCICRTSLILSLYPALGKGVEFVMDIINKKKDIVLFTDELRNMTFSEDLGMALFELARPEHSYRGILNLVSSQVTNRYELALKLAEKYNLETGHLKHGLSAESGMNRPLDVSLDTTRTTIVLKTKLRGVDEYLRDHK